MTIFSCVVYTETFSHLLFLLQALICSSFVPLYSGVLPPKFRGVVSVCSMCFCQLIEHLNSCFVVAGHGNHIRFNINIKYQLK